MSEHLGHGKANRLIHEKSPYLLQHAYNPVDWYPWGAEAFENAEKQDRPIFLSIGYSTCHWCHVMERESFEDQDIAELMNGTFISIKVDREERPDIDSTYMTICQLMTGGGGWPLTLIMTPDKKPFFAATYLPRETRFGQIGMKELIPRIGELWKRKREQLLNSAQEVVSHLQSAEQPSRMSGPQKLGKETLDATFDDLSLDFDEEHGGFGGAPKFPGPHNLTFLLRYWKRSGNEKALAMVEKTLTSMRLGGINDPIGHGFHRYSVDSRWFQPHFEKMLYDQAMLTIAYAEAYQATGKEEYIATANETLAFVLREMTSPDGGFYTSIDADSEGEEGKYYLWRTKEIKEVLCSEEVDFITEVFNLQENGNLPNETTHKDAGNNILYMNRTPERIASDMKLPTKEFMKRLEAVRVKLFKHREKRVHPSRDEKILTDLNGLMIAALAKSAQAFHQENYALLATRAADFILTNMREPNGGLYHRYRDDQAVISGFLDDYAFFTWGLIELYEATLQTRFLESALKLTAHIRKHFSDEKGGGFFFSAEDAESVIIRKKDAYDGAYPSGNSVAAMNLLRLAHLTGEARLEEDASRLMSSFSGSVSRVRTAYTYLLAALDFAVGPTSEVVIVGERNKDDTHSMIESLQKGFTPNKVVLLKPTGEESQEVTRLAEYAKDLFAKEGKATAFVCRGHKCNLPTTSPSEMLRLLDRS